MGLKIDNGSIISNNSVYSNVNEGLYLINSSRNIITNNTIFSNGGKGIYLSNSHGNKIFGNNIYSNYQNNIYLRYSIENDINDNSITMTDYGITLSYSERNNVFNNDISFNKYGIHLWYSIENRIDGNNVSFNKNDGIYLEYSEMNAIINNKAINNSNNGIRCYNSNWNNLTANNVSNNSVGLCIYYSSSNNIIKGNNISNNAYGIVLRYDSDNNVFHHNNLINNSFQVTVETSTCDNNVWDDGVGQGNYWSDYTGMDNGAGGRPMGDGIGDNQIPHPYISQGQGYFGLDEYPLMEPIPDTLPPRIQLVSPSNESIIQPSVILNFEISDWNLDSTSFHLNGGPEQTLSLPYDISTSTWSDGVHELTVQAKDKNNNSVLKTYQFTIDSIKPYISLISPNNNSLISSGVILNFSITDLHLSQVEYSIEGGANTPFSDPYNLQTNGLSEGNYTILINAIDAAGNSNSSWFLFTIDNGKPSILLNSPWNNSLIRGETILDFSITEGNLLEANYSINGRSNISFSDPFNISTIGWPDGDYRIQVNAMDIVGNTNSSWYIFTIDSTKPSILLNSPQNNSIFQSGVVLDFIVVDEHSTSVNFSINDGNDIFIFDPYDIYTFGWDDGEYTIQINVFDLAGNLNTSWFFFTIDSTLPVIILNNPLTNSIVPNGTVIDISIIDANLQHANYTINGGGDNQFNPPYNISTSGWPDGDYSIQIQAIDLAGNSNSSVFFFTIDSSPPIISLISPDNNSVIHKGTLLNFYVMDHNLILSNYSINGGNDISFSDPYDISTDGWDDENYEILITALDIAGNLSSMIFHFVIDSTDPIIQLNSPDNNSYIHEGIDLDFNVVEPNLEHANYSINGGSEIPITDPFDIPTSDWPDDEYTIQINALDRAGNFNSALYFFIIDSTEPSIMLNFPDNNSYIQGGVFLNFTVDDAHLGEANYSINGGDLMPLLAPHTISTETLADSNYTILVVATDLIGNTQSSWFSFTIDSTSPSIILNSPANNAVIQVGSILDFNIVDVNLLWTNYSINGDSFTPFSHPFDINTIGWSDGRYIIKIDAIDKAGNVRSSLFEFTIDSTKPLILLHSPITDSVIKGGTRIDFSVIDSNLLNVQYSINGNDNIDILEPYDIPTEGWLEGNYSVLIESWDAAGNFNSSQFRFTIDNTAPSIWFDSNFNHTTIQTGQTIQIRAPDPDTEQVVFSIDGGENQVLEEPYILYPYMWPQGAHIIHIKTKDAVGNEAILWFDVKIDTISPYITYCEPSLNAREVDNGTNVVIAFSEPMNMSNPEQYISISPSMNFTCQWNEEGTILTISFSLERLADGTTYTLKINKQLSDTSDNGIRSGFDLAFTTTGEPLIGKSPPSSEPSSSLYWAIIVLGILLLTIIVLLYIRRIKNP